jgi:hypothetical protein
MRVLVKLRRNIGKLEDKTDAKWVAQTECFS